MRARRRNGSCRSRVALARAGVVTTAVMSVLAVSAGTAQASPVTLTYGETGEWCSSPALDCRFTHTSAPEALTASLRLASPGDGTIEATGDAGSTAKVSFAGTRNRNGRWARARVELIVNSASVSSEEPDHHWAAVGARAWRSGPNDVEQGYVDFWLLYSGDARSVSGQTYVLEWELWGDSSWVEFRAIGSLGSCSYGPWETQAIDEAWCQAHNPPGVVTADFDITVVSISVS